MAGAMPSSLKEHTESPCTAVGIGFEHQFLRAACRIRANLNRFVFARDAQARHLDGIEFKVGHDHLLWKFRPYGICCGAAIKKLTNEPSVIAGHRRIPPITSPASAIAGAGNEAGAWNRRRELRLLHTNRTRRPWS